MDTYSYISENGTVRQIEDLLAKARNDEQDTEIQANRNAINALSASVEESLKKTVRVAEAEDTVAADALELLKKKAEVAIRSGLLQTVGTTIIVPGGWYGNQYGQTLVSRITSAYYAVNFFGQVSYIYGVYDATSETATGNRLDGTPL